MNSILTTLLIIALAIAILFDFIRIVQYINMRKVAKEFDERAETTLDEIINILTAMVEDKKGYESLMLDRTKDIQDEIHKHYKQLKEIQDTLRKIEKRK